VIAAPVTTQAARRAPAPRRQVGISLIEALVTLFVLSIGMLGVAGLQSVGLQAGHSATLRSQAVFHAQELIERMRANRAALGDYAGVAVDHGCADRAAVAISCTSAELAADDLYRWRQSVRASLGAALGDDDLSIAVDTSVAPAIVTVSIGWTGRKGSRRYDSSTRI